MGSGSAWVRGAPRARGRILPKGRRGSPFEWRSLPTFDNSVCYHRATHGRFPSSIPERSAMIRLDGVTKSDKDVDALADVSVEVTKGEFVFVVGPSGSGKSTLIKLLTREEHPTKGAIHVAGKNISQLS